MTQPSIFREYLDRLLPVLGTYIDERVNGGKEKKLTYLHKKRLRKVFSPDQKWETSSANTRYVKADYVAMDSPLPLKKRGTIASSNGDLPKIGARRIMKESDINSINIMIAQLSTMKSGSDSYIKRKLQIIKKLSDDLVFANIALDEQNEFAYLYAISHGEVLVQADVNDPKSSGLGLRAQYGYLPANHLHTATPGVCDSDDIQKVIDKADADGNTIAMAMMSRSLLDRIRRSRWACELVAKADKVSYTSKTVLPVPSRTEFTEAFEEEYGMPVEVVDRTVLCEKNGKDYPVKPFNPDRIIFLPDADFDGSLVYGELAEKSHPADGVSYSTVDEYKLISRLRLSEPTLQEVTKGQAMVLPVIEDGNAIYTLDFLEAKEEESGQTEKQDQAGYENNPAGAQG